MMLISFRKGACAIAAAATIFGASAVQAETYSVLIVDGAYFPPLLSVVPGDAVVFTNNSTVSHTISGEGDVWTSGAIAVEASYTLDVTDETPPNYSGMGADDVLMEGALSLDAEVDEPAPVEN